MGGVPPLGYDVANRRLVPNEREAKLIRHIFQRFVELGSSTALVKELKLDGVTSKAWTTQDGKTRDGRLTLSVPIQIKRRSGCKLVTLPNGETAHGQTVGRGADTAPVGAGQGAPLARHAGIRGSEVVEGDCHAGGDRQQLRERMVNLTTLAPDIVAAILDETLPAEVTLFDLASGTPLWDEQRRMLHEAGRG